MIFNNINETKFGSTEAGQAWCKKALDPAHSYAGYGTYPDDDANPIIPITYKNQFEFTPDGGTEMCDGVINITGNILVPGGAEWANSDGTDSQTAYWENENLDGDDLTERMDNLYYRFSAYRMVHCFVTVTFISSDMYNQGSLAVCQYKLPPNRVNYYDGETAAINVVRNVFMYNMNEVPSYNNAVQMPRAYKGFTKDGVYAPMKLDDEARTFHDIKDSIVVLNNHSDTNMTPYQTYHVNTSFVDPLGAPTYWPFSAYYTTGTSTWTLGKPMIKPCSANVITIPFKGISKNCTVRVNIEMGYEFQASVGSSMTTFYKEHSEYDELAIIMYQKVSNMLFDAYPAEYNDFGKFWNVISKVASTAYKVIKPGLKTITGGMSEPITNIVELVAKKINQSAIAKINKQKKQAEQKKILQKKKPLPSTPVNLK